MRTTSFDPANSRSLFGGRIDEPERVELYSPLTPEECIRRLMDAIDVQKSGTFSLARGGGSREISGIIDGLTIRLRKRIDYSSSYQQFLTATLRPEKSGTRISGSFGMRPFVRRLMRIWFAGVLIIGGVFALVALSVALLGSSQDRYGTWKIVIVPIGILFFGHLMVSFGRTLAKDEPAFITAFLKKTLDIDSEL